jgi:uncharacterized spore protein YtfJ
MDLNDLLSGLMADMRKVTDTASMIGEPVKVGESRMVPLLGVTIGFGTAATDLSGSGERKGARADGAGAGGTMVVTPKAFVVIDADGVPQLIALKDGKYATVQKAIVLDTKLGASSPALPREEGSSPALERAAKPKKLSSGGGSNP